MWQQFVDKNRWDKLVSSQPHSPFLQSWAWGDFQESWGREVLRLSWNDEILAQVIKMPLASGKFYWYIPHGPILAGAADDLQTAFAELQKTLGKHGALFLRVDPTVAFNPQVKIKAISATQPQCTLVLDLSRQEEEILSKMHHKTRYNLKVAKKNEITIQAPPLDVDNLEFFWRLMKKTSKRDRFSSHPKDYYQKLLHFFSGNGEIKTKLYMACYEDEPIAGLILLTYKDTAFYLHGASDYDYRSYMAPHKLHWEVIKNLKTLGFKSYDFWGIDANKWPGVTRFKLGWGGKGVEHPGSFDLSTSWFWYLAYKISRKIF